MPWTSSLFNKVYLLLVIGLATFFLTSKFWLSRPVIAWDITLYYSYLPALFIYDDIKFEDPSQEWYDRQFDIHRNPDGGRYVKMTSGMAMLYSPFFLGSHLYALNSDYPADGFSAPYRFGLLLSALFFCLLGLWFFGNWLRRFFPQAIAAAVMLIVFFGTNMPYYSFVEPMSHIYNFALVSMTLFWSFKYFDKPRPGLAVLIGLACGLLVLIRPTNIIALLFPVIVLILRRKELSTREVFGHLGLTILFAFLVWLPQLFYWKYMTGSWLVYSYGEEGFFFTDPEIWKGLFSYRKGWFLYSPVLLLAVPGFVYLFKKYRHLAWASVSTLVVALWITFSWWCWWYGGGFGARALIEFLPFMGLGLAAFLLYIRRQSIWLQLPVYGIIGFLLFTSVFMNYQYKEGIIHNDSMSKELYWNQFLKKHYLRDYEEQLDPPDYEKALRNEE